VCRHLGQVGRLPRSRKIANSPLWVDQWEARETVRLKRGLETRAPGARRYTIDRHGSFCGSVDSY
jgi:hypothetical protein